MSIKNLIVGNIIYISVGTLSILLYIIFFNKIAGGAGDSFLLSSFAVLATVITYKFLAGKLGGRGD